MNNKYYGSKTEVFNGTAQYTKGGLTKKDIVRIDDGYGNYRYKSKRQQAAGKKKGSFREHWSKAMKKARKELGIQGFVPVGGKTREGKELLSLTRKFAKL